MSGRVKGKRPRPRAGKCRRCGCTDDYACELGCAWVDSEHTRCSECFVWDEATGEFLRIRRDHVA